MKGGLEEATGKAGRRLGPGTQMGLWGGSAPGMQAPELVSWQGGPCPHPSVPGLIQGQGYREARLREGACCRRRDKGGWWKKEAGEDDELRAVGTACKREGRRPESSPSG